MSLNDGEKSTIVCPKYDKYYTVVEIRSVFFGNDRCPSNNGSKTDVMERCQGRNKCHLEVSAEIFNNYCLGITKFLTVTYRCQSGECKKNLAHLPSWSRTESQEFSQAPLSNWIVQFRIHQDRWIKTQKTHLFTKYWKMSFIVPHFDYCAKTGHFCNKGSAEKLEKRNKKAARFVFRDKRTPYENLLSVFRK